MKKTFYFAIAIALIVSACSKDETPAPALITKTDKLPSGAGYVNDVYYSLKNGVVKTQPKNDWDLAFGTINQNASILINSGIGDSLFVWKGGTIANFNKVATLDNKKRLATNFDADSWFNNSAFEQNVKPTDPYDQGWGIYNGTTHDVAGDSVYVLKLANKTYKKIAIIKRISATREFVFKIADLAKDAVSDSITIKPGDYKSKNFIYYSIANKAVLDREPDNTTWDFVFTKYDSRVANYPLVTGILTNEGIESAKLADADSVKPYSQVTFVKKVSGIGFDWKSFNNATSTYVIKNQFYYIKTTASKYYRINFKAFDYTIGETTFELKELN